MAQHDSRYREAGCLFAMKRGAVLRREIWKGNERFWLEPKGVNIRTAVGRAVIESEHVQAGNDGLFADSASSQTFFYKIEGPHRQN